MEFVNINGEILDGQKTSISRPAEGIFETMKATKGKIFLEELHFEILFHGFDVMKFTAPRFFTAEKFSKEIFELCEKNDSKGLVRVRLTIFPENDEGLNYIIETSSLEILQESLIIDIYPLAGKSCDDFSNLKKTNRFPYDEAARFAGENGFDDVLVLNEHGRICDSTISNVFWIKDGKIFTPPLSEGCVAGVMRRWIMEKLQAVSYELQEKKCEVEELENADEIFLTNAIRGIRRVRQFSGRKLMDERVKEIIQSLSS